MPSFVVKVTLKSGDWLPPITVVSKDAQTAESVVRSQLPMVDDDDKVEAKEVKGDKFKAYFGAQEEDKVVVRVDWRWQGDEPSPD